VATARAPHRSSSAVDDADARPIYAANFTTEAPPAMAETLTGDLRVTHGRFNIIR
jgi:hypothetical protein